MTMDGFLYSAGPDSDGDPEKKQNPDIKSPEKPDDKYPMC